VLVFWAGSLSFTGVLGLIFFMVYVMEDYRMALQIDFYEKLILGITILFRIVGGVLFVLWMRRAYYNLKALDLPTSYSDGWAVGAWLVPILNLVRPFQIMNELVRKPEQALLKGDLQETFHLKEGGPLRLQVLSKFVFAGWWGCWVINLFLNRFINTFSRSMEETDYPVFILMIGLFVLLFTLSGLLLLRIMKHQHRLSTLLHQIRKESPATETEA
jgi:hypothetical protein